MGENEALSASESELTFKEKRERVPFGERRRRTLVAFLGKNQAGDGFRNNTAQEVIKEIYKDKLDKEQDPCRKEERLRKLMLYFSTSRRDLIYSLGKLDLPLDNLPPLKRGLKKWLLNQPEYADKPIKDLISMVKRKMPFR